jgi:hypothetical protein
MDETTPTLRRIPHLSVRPLKSRSELHPAIRVRHLAYHAYGLTIISDVEIPELPPLRDLLDRGSDRINLRILGSRRSIEDPAHWLNVSAHADGTPWLSTAKIEGGYLLRFPRLADFVIDPSGHDVSCIEAGDGVTTVTLRHLAIDHVMPRVLNLRGIESLHATAVAAGSGAIAFIGAAGAGKSTLAASFHLAGLESYCDDCLVLHVQNGRIVATPAYPGVRLCDDSFMALMGESERGVSVAQYTGKTRLLGTGSGFRGDRLPLGRICVLQRRIGEDAEGVTPAIARVSAGAAFPLLVGASFPLDLRDRTMLARHFRLLTRVAAIVPIRQLMIPNDFSALPAVRAVVMADLEAP